MDTEKAQQVLDELKGVRPEYLNEPAKRLFEAIMTIADERDMYRRQVNEAFDRGWIHKDTIKRIAIPTPNNPIPLKMQQSEFYNKILKLVEER